MAAHHVTDTQRVNKPVYPQVVVTEPGQSNSLCGCRHCASAPWAASDCGLPLKVQFERKTTLWLCVCRGSKHYPYCDGSHNPPLLRKHWLKLKQRLHQLVRRR
ncbi:CDGSH iron-sulfur domain-containing protein [Thalassolituus marinus]|uniref:CDGSH iron-sulfur domain-containing protein n=1 Tax=Thalassolituus marinus TaxID=671053 RepID=UPI001CE3B12E